LNILEFLPKIEPEGLFFAGGRNVLLDIRVFGTIFFLAMVLVFLPAPVSAQTTFDGILIQAESGERNLEKKSMELSGNIQIVFKGQHLSADRAVIYQDRKEVEAEGRVLFVTPKATLGGDKIIINYETNKGTVYSGFIQSGQVIFEGAVIEKNGEDQYTAIQSQYTSCTTCPAAWSFSGQSIQAELGGYALIKNSFLVKT
jgi:LPS-assembly protein